MKPSFANLEQASVAQQCRALRLPAVADQCASLAEEAIKQRLTYLRFLEALLATELEERERNIIARRIKDAHLPRMKTLDEFDFSKAPQIQATKIHELAQGGYIERAEPVILIGDCGTGKTHLLTGLCVAACRQKRRVRFATAAALVNELVEAKQQLQLRRVLARWERYDLIAIDEVGYVPMADLGAEFLQQLALPLCDLVGMHIELLRQLQKRLLTLQRSQGHLRLERRCMVPTGTSAHSISSFRPS
jgi:DNA replication protein DnaC